MPKTGRIQPGLRFDLPVETDDYRDRKLTLSQNYKRLGLSSRLTAATGGIEKKKAGPGDDDSQTTPRDSLAIGGPRAKALIPQEVQVEKDPVTGRIVRVIRPESDGENINPLNDPLNDIMDFEKKETQTRPATGVVAQLEQQAAEEAELEAKKKRPRQQSQREEEWIATLVEKHGDNVRAMARDRKLNPMQQAEGDIGRRVRKWLASREVAT